MTLRLRLSLLIPLGILSACGDSKFSLSQVFDAPRNSKDCKPRLLTYPRIRESNEVPPVKVKFSELANDLKAACSECHGGYYAKIPDFKMIFEYKGKNDGVNDNYYVQGLSEAAGKKAISAVSRNMPPGNIRKANEKHFDQLAKKLKAWQAAGMPEDSFVYDPGTPQTVFKSTINHATGHDLGDCVPKPEIVGIDPEKDAFFENMTTLPDDLGETDLFTFDALYLAKKGTIEYNVEYPLWADNAEKGRYVHVPAKKDEQGNFKPQAVQLLPDKNTSLIPPNTRFYKTFYKSFKYGDNKTTFRKVETRIIVTRAPGKEPLYGSYKWDEREERATLVKTPYRNGTGFKDDIFEVRTGKPEDPKRKYVIPGADRCVDCHKGSPAQDFILGFTPLQLNRRAMSPTNINKKVTRDDLSQVDRLQKSGVINGFQAAAELPQLEAFKFTADQKPPRTDHELRFGAYAVGNCAHCHNPDGFAMKESFVNLNFSPGFIFGRPLPQSIYTNPVKALGMQTYTPSRVADKPNNSDVLGLLYHRVTGYDTDEGTLQMPMHTPGGVDCNLLTLTGRWIISMFPNPSPLVTADTYTPDCKPNPSEFRWVDIDRTDFVQELFTPRRGDWADEKPDAMPDEILKADFFQNDPEFEAMAKKEFYGGFYQKKSNLCVFPEKGPIPDPEPYHLAMTDDGRIKWGQISKGTPGSTLYNSQCSKCHGGDGNGKTGIADAILNADGTTRVANLTGGLFGGHGKNLEKFSAGENSSGRLEAGKNYAPNYLYWMANGGTRVQFPEVAKKLLNSTVAGVSGNMISPLIKDCQNLVPGIKSVNGGSLLIGTGMPSLKMFREVCAFKNYSPDDPKIVFKMIDRVVVPASAEAKEYTRNAGRNIAAFIYAYLRDEVSKGKFTPPLTQCELVPEFRKRR